MIPTFSKDPNALVHFTSAKQLDDLRKENQDRAIVLMFYADWHDPCKVLREVMSEACKTHTSVKIGWVSCLLPVRRRGG